MRSKHLVYCLSFVLVFFFFSVKVKQSVPPYRKKTQLQEHTQGQRYFVEKINKDCASLEAAIACSMALFRKQTELNTKPLGQMYLL